MMKHLSLLLLTCLLLSACVSAAPSPQPTFATLPAVRFPPTWTPTPGGKTTSSSPLASITPRPTRALSPVATPAASTVYTATDGLFTIELPANWSTQTGERQLVSAENVRQMSYIASGAPGTAPQPAILLFYKWPNSGPISNDNAWEQAFAVASLAAKVCPMTLTTGGPIDVGGETGNYFGYEDGCGVQGELVGFVHERVNYGILIEAPQPLWKEWQPILRDIVGTLKFQ